MIHVLNFCWPALYSNLSKLSDSGVSIPVHTTCPIYVFQLFVLVFHNVRTYKVTLLCVKGQSQITLMSSKLLNKLAWI